MVKDNGLHAKAELLRKAKGWDCQCDIEDFFKANPLKSRKLIAEQDVPNWSPKECLWALMGADDLTESEKAALIARLDTAPHLKKWAVANGHC